MKKVVKLLTFIIILSFLLIGISKILWAYPNSIRYFFDEPKDSIDVVYLGASNAYAHFNTVLAFDTYGFTTGLLSSDAQPVSGIKNLIIESRNFQNPKVYVIDLGGFAFDIKNYTEGDIRKVTDNMPFGINRFKTIDYMLKYTDISKKDYVNYYFSFLTYHSSWKVINYERIAKNDLYKGYLLNSSTIVSDELSDFNWKRGTKEPSKENLEIFNDLIEYIREEKLNAVFIIPPRSFDDDQVFILNYLSDILTNNNLTIINFNTVDLNIIYNHDLYNAFHLNACGAIKFTKYFSKYLDDTYDLPNHKNSKIGDSWKSEYERLKNDYFNITGKTYDDLLNECIIKEN